MKTHVYFSQGTAHFSRFHNWHAAHLSIRIIINRKIVSDFLSSHDDVLSIIFYFQNNYFTVSSLFLSDATN